MALERSLGTQRKTAICHMEYGGKLGTILYIFQANKTELSTHRIECAGAVGNICFRGVYCSRYHCRPCSFNIWGGIS